MEFFKSISIGPVNIYITTGRMKRRNKRDDLYRNKRKKILRMKHQIWKHNGGRCEECGREFDEDVLEVHHIVPVSERPDLICAQSNIHIVCPECHNRLHGRPLGGVLPEMLVNKLEKSATVSNGSGFFLYLCGKIADMTDLEYDYATCDMFLKMVKDLPDGRVNFEILESVSRTSPIPDEEEVIAFLVEEGLLKKVEDGYQITRRGRIVIDEGGLYARVRRKRVMAIFSIAGAVGGIVAAILSLLSLIL